MAQSLNNVAVEQFSMDFENQYQVMRSMLPDAVRKYTGLVGSSYHLKLAGEIVMHDRGAYQSNIPPQDVSYTDIIMTFKDKVANVPSDIFEQAGVNASERMNLAKSAAWSISRQEVQIIIDEFDVGYGNTVVAGGTNLTIEKFREAKRILDAANVPQMGRYAFMHANNLYSLLGETQATNSLYTGRVQAVIDGQIPDLFGFTIITIGDMTEGGL